MRCTVYHDTQWMENKVRALLLNYYHTILFKKYIAKDNEFKNTYENDWTCGGLDISWTKLGQ